MTTSTIDRATPQTVFLGTNDISTRPRVLEPEVIPAHLPKVYIYAATGPTEPQLVVGDARLEMYGDASFDLRSAYATHATVLSNTVDAKANAQMIERMIPADAPPPANIRYCLDLLVTQVPEYQRNTDGSYKVDETGAPIPTGTMIAGAHIGKWVTEYIKPDVDGASTFGKGTQKPGDQIDATLGTQSIRIPMFDAEVPHIGKAGNNNGLRIWAPTMSSSNPVDQRLIAATNSYPFRIAAAKRSAVNATSKIAMTTQGVQFVPVSLKENSLDPYSDQTLYLGDEFIKQYQDLVPSNGAPPLYGPWGRLHVYQNNVASVLKQLYDAEVPFIDSFSDLEGIEGEEFRLNIFGAVSTQDSPYHTFLLNTKDANAIRMSETATSFASGGGDGTMSEALLNGLVAEAVANYNDLNSPLQDMAKYPESHIWDSGFSLATKMALCNFIGKRKDTMVVLSTHDVLGRVLTAAEESSLAIALRTRLQMFPESDYFGTATMRGVIVGRSGTLLNSQYRKKLPLSIELAALSAEYMGAGNGKWKPGFAFDESPRNQVTMFSDVNITWTPLSARNKDWDNGLIWVEQFSRRALYWPALKTVYDNDTSVLTGYFTACAITTLQKVGNSTRMKFSGNMKLTDAQLVERVNQDIIDNTISRFDDRYVIQPETWYTKADQARGYSWTTKIKIFAPNMKTVGTLSVEANRLSALAPV